MKNFYDATVIKPSLKLDIALRIKPTGSVPAQLQINDKLWTTTIFKEETFKYHVNIIDPIKIQIQIDRKHPEALEIELDIDGNKVLPLYQDQFGVNSYIDSNNIWRVEIANFYSWYHKITGQGWII